MDDDSMLHADLDALVGTTLHGRYRVGPRLGTDAAGVVFAAFDLELVRDMAIKVLHSDSENAIDVLTTESGIKYVVTERGGLPMHTYTGNHAPVRTGAHLGIGQLATGQYAPIDEAIDSEADESHSWHASSTPSAQSKGGIPRPIPVVTVEQIERRPPPPAARKWLSWALVGVAGALVLVGVVLVVSLALDMR